ncbi:hypothetical protein H4582DRAFT_1820177, partial [Lactarius indigo]
SSLLYILHVKVRFPAKGPSGHRLFISAFMLALKVICDDTYLNKSCCIVLHLSGCSLWEVNHMEHEMCSYLEGQLNLDSSILRDLGSRVRHDFLVDHN